VEFLSAVFGFVPVADNAQHYLKIVREKYALRSTYLLSLDMQRRCSEQQEDCDQSIPFCKNACFLLQKKKRTWEKRGLAPS
jgi:hypothetical protein